MNRFEKSRRNIKTGIKDNATGKILHRNEAIYFLNNYNKTIVEIIRNNNDILKEKDDKIQYIENTIKHLAETEKTEMGKKIYKNLIELLEIG